MGRSLRVLLALSLLTVILAPYQNCSVYKSEGKKFYERSGVEYASEMQEPEAQIPTIKPRDTSSEPAGCSPYLSVRETNVIFSNETEHRMFVDEDQDLLTCIISSNADLTRGSETAVCTISANNLIYLALADTMEVYPDPHPSGPLSLGSFGFVKMNEKNRPAQFYFVGAHQGAKEAVACQFTYDSRESLDQDLETILERGSFLVHSIAESID